MGRITPSFRQLYEEVISELRTELQGAFVDLGHKKAFDLLLKSVESRTSSDGKFYVANSMRQTKYSSISSQQKTNIAALTNELKEKDSIIQDLGEQNN